MGRTPDIRVRFYLILPLISTGLSLGVSAGHQKKRRRCRVPRGDNASPPLTHSGFAGEVSRDPQSICRPNEGWSGDCGSNSGRRFKPVAQTSVWRPHCRIRNVRITAYAEVNPSRMAYLVSSATLLIFNLTMICWRWVSTVLMLMCRLSPIRAEVLPSAMSCSTSRSLGDSN